MKLVLFTLNDYLRYSKIDLFQVNEIKEEYKLDNIKERKTH